MLLQFKQRNMLRRQRIAKHSLESPAKRKCGDNYRQRKYIHQKKQAANIVATEKELLTEVFVSVQLLAVAVASCLVGAAREPAALYKSSLILQ